MLLFGLIALAFLQRATSVSLPRFFMRCSRNDPNLNACFERAANDAIKKFKSGAPSLGVPSMDPLEIKRISIKQPGNGRISLDMVFENVKFSNISNSQIKTKLDLPNNLLSGRFLIPHTRMESDYEVNGKILLVPVRGKGKSMIDIWGTRAEFTLRVVPREVRGETYYFLDSLHYKIEGADSMKMKFTNLFGKNRALSNSLNDVLNDNWRELYDTVSPSFSEVLRAYFFNLGRKIFNKVPINEIFPERV